MRILLLDGNENQAVASVRSLDRAGHRVVVGSDHGWSKAGWSRHASASFSYPSPRHDVERFIDHLVAQVESHAGTLVLPLTESTTLPVSANRERLLAAGARLVLPSHDAVLRAFDKNVTRQIAERLGLATPRTRLARTPGEAAVAATELGFPVVVKPHMSEEVGPHGSLRASGSPLYASTAGQLDEAFQRLRARSSLILIQEFVPGSGAGYFALIDRGELRAEFAHRRIRDVRPTGSGSAVRESVAIDPGLRDASLALLRELEWHGVAMVEFRLRADGTPVFLEVNGRFWNSLALAVHAGVDFPALVAAMAGNADVPPTLDYRTGVRCRWLLGDARHLAAVFVGPPPGFPGRYPGRIETALAVMKPTRGMRHDNFLLSDPMPELGDWLHFFLRRLPAAVRLRRTQ